MSTEHWNDAKGKATGASLEARSLNSYLNDIRFKLTECYRELQLKQAKISTTQIYTKVLENKVSEDMTKLKTRLSQDKTLDNASNVG